MTCVLALVLAVAPMVASARGSGAAIGAIRFATDLETAFEAASLEDVPLVVLFVAVWCQSCRQLEERILLDPAVQELADELVWARIDIDRELSLARAWGVDATPTMFVLGPDGAVRRKIVGAVAATELAGLLSAAPPALPAEAAGLAQVHRHSALTLGPEGYRARSICFSQVGYGPLGIRSQSPFQGLRLAMFPRTPSTLAGGQHQLRAGVTWANVWAVDQGVFDPAGGELGPYVLDFETLDLDLGYAYGLSDTFQLELGYESRRRFGGLMDGFIEGFHDLFGIDQSGRDLWPRDRSLVLIDPGGGRPPLVRDEQGGQSIVRSLLATFQHNLSCGTELLPALSWSATVRSAVGGDELEGGSLDFALSAALSRRLGRFYLYLTLGHTWYGSREVAGLELAATQFSLLTAVEWRFRPRMSLVLQYLGSEGAVTELGPFSESSHEVVIGLKWEPDEGGVLEIGLLENIVIFDNSPDFGLHAAYTRRF